ncbi:MAG: TrmB family transcriptional regulator [Candidatus Kariarchaeaceae archaeon]
MTDLDEAILALTALGWSEYESKTYSALVQQGKSTASQIAKKSQVPANRVYQILEKLTGKGHVNRLVARGGPSFYEAVNPQEVLDKNKSEHDNKISEAQGALVKLQERESDTDIPKSYTIIGDRELKVQLQNIINKSNRSILLFVDTLIEISNNELIEILKNKKLDFDQNENLRILTTPRGVNDAYELEVLRKLEEIQMRVTPETTPPISTILLVVDEDIILFVSYAFPSDEMESRDYFGVILEDKRTARMFTRMFESSWDESNEPN